MQNGVVGGVLKGVEGLQVLELLFEPDFVPLRALGCAGNPFRRADSLGRDRRAGSLNREVNALLSISVCFFSIEGFA